MGPFLLPVAAVAFGVIGVGVMNSSAFMPLEVLAERYRKNGVFPLSDVPDEGAAPDFAARVRRRERWAALGSSCGVALAAVATTMIPLDAVSLSGVVFVSVFLGRTVVMALLGAREVREVTPATRISRGHLVPLGERVHLPSWWVLVGTQLIFLVAYLAASQPICGWVLGVAISSVVATIGSLFFARWLALAPQAAASSSDLAWSDAVRTRDLGAIMMAGPISAIGVATTAFTASVAGAMNDPVYPLALYAWAYCLALALLGIAFGRLTDARQRYAASWEGERAAH